MEGIREDNRRAFDCLGSSFLREAEPDQSTVCNQANTGGPPSRWRCRETEYS
jgi:hypothetical protein